MLSRTDFVKFFDSQVTDFKRVNNENDLVPIVPGRFLGFSHLQGEIHIVDDDSKEIVARRETTVLMKTSVGSKIVPGILSGNALHHLGPYNRVFIGSVFCN
ncbi:hypothetical protein DFH08DRAFT_184923 [Mycena albidolilacea]|uniref:Uncharacterized protein n=1 Tax=Mycena albidolilacea TaxID=1033008 RepID=A0AAD7F5W6_9AGAR|nr:hypothetical protein DFH08DRAFT_184923 [Mycena albidolilacea]